METRSSKKRKVALSPGGATVAGPASPSMPMPIGSGIPQTDGAEETPMTPPVHTEGDRLIGVDTTTVQRYQPAPVPPTDDPPFKRPVASIVQILFHENSQHILCTVQILSPWLLVILFLFLVPM